MRNRFVSRSQGVGSKKTDVCTIETRWFNARVASSHGFRKGFQPFDMHIHSMEPLLTISTGSELFFSIHAFVSILRNKTGCLSLSMLEGRSFHSSSSCLLLLLPVFFFFILPTMDRLYGSFLFQKKRNASMKESLQPYPNQKKKRFGIE